MKVHSLRGPKEVPYDGATFVTDEFDDVDVPDELGESLLLQEDAWVSARGRKKQKSDGGFDEGAVAPEGEEG